ncbi:MAG: hypothetical protein ACM3PY_01045, partial [Omnitrophica WOR_2 bacterium]
RHPCLTTFGSQGWLPYKVFVGQALLVAAASLPDGIGKSSVTAPASLLAERATPWDRDEKTSWNKSQDVSSQSQQS